jgi:hypothetical protein
MFVAKELRKKSIAEYLLYMWQIEDIIRAYGCSLPVIKKNYIERFDFTPEQKDDEACKGSLRQDRIEDLQGQG